MDTTTTPSESGGSKKVTKKAYAELEKRCAALERQTQRQEERLNAKASILDKKNYDDTIKDITELFEEAIQSVGFRVDGSFKSEQDHFDYIRLSVKKIQEQEEEIQTHNSILDKIKAVVKEGLESVEEDPVFDEDRLEDHIDALVEKIQDLEEKVGETERIPLLEEDALKQCNRADDLNFELQQERVKSARLEQSNSQSRAGLDEAQKVYYEQEGRIARLENTIRDRDATVAQQTAFISNAESSIGAYESTIRNLENQLSQNSASSNDVKYQEEFHRMKAQHNAEMGSLRAEVGSLRRNIEGQATAHAETMRQKEQEKTSEISSLVKKHEASESGLKGQFSLEKTDLEKAVSTLRDEISKHKAEMEDGQTKFGAEKADLQSQLMKLYSENEQAAEAKTQLQSKHDSDMKATRESIAQLVSQCEATPPGQAQPSIIATMQIRRLEKENTELIETNKHLKEMVTALKKEYEVQPGKLYDIMNVRKNSKQWSKEIRDAKDYAISAKQARQRTKELNRGLDTQLGQLIAENHHLKLEKQSLERDVESRNSEIAKKDREVTRQSKEITRLAVNLDMAEKKAQLLQRHHEGVGGTEGKLLMAMKELNDKQAKFDAQTTTLENIHRELKGMQEREYEFNTSEQSAVRTSKKIEYLEKEKERLESLSQSQKDLLERNKEWIARMQFDRPLVLHTPPSTPNMTRDTVLQLMKEPDHILPRLSTATSLSHSLSPIVTIMNVEPTPVVPEEGSKSNAATLNTESRNNEDVIDAVDSRLFPEEENNDAGANEAPLFPKWQVLFFVLAFIGTMVSWAMNPSPLTASLPRGDVCQMFEKPLEQLGRGPTSIMICAGSADDYANLSLHYLDVLGGTGTTWG